MRYGIGVDSIDIAAATEAGVVVASPAAHSTHEVAEHACALLLAVTRQLVAFDKIIRAGDWRHASTTGKLHRLAVATQLPPLWIRDRSIVFDVPETEKADPANPGHVAAPFAGVVTPVVASGTAVDAGQTVATIEALKLEASITAPVAGRVERLAITTPRQVEAGDLIAVIGICVDMDVARVSCRPRTRRTHPRHTVQFVHGAGAYPGDRVACDGQRRVPLHVVIDCGPGRVSRPPCQVLPVTPKHGVRPMFPGLVGGSCLGLVVSAEFAVSGRVD